MSTSLLKHVGALLLIFTLTLSMAGCDSAGPETDEPGDDEAKVSLTLSNTGQKDFPGTPSRVTIRIWDTDGRNTALRTVDFPAEGETREVSAFTAPGDLFVGIMAHDSDGIVSFAAVTDEAQTFTGGQSAEVNFQNSLITWDFEYILVGGTFAVGESIQLETREQLGAAKADQLIEGITSQDGQDGIVPYDSEPFGASSEAQFEGDIEWFRTEDNGIIRRRTDEQGAGDLQIRDASLLDSMFVRVQLPTDSRWGDEPKSIVRPHPDSPPLDIAEVASDINISFSREK
jgi:hypothetical protein